MPRGKTANIDPDYLRRLTAQGMTEKEIAVMLGVSRETVSNYKAKHGIYKYDRDVPREKRKIPWRLKEAFQHFVLDTADEMSAIDVPPERVIELARAGLQNREIMQTLGMTRPQLDLYKCRHGIKIREVRKWQHSTHDQGAQPATSAGRG